VNRKEKVRQSHGTASAGSHEDCIVGLFPYHTLLEGDKLQPVTQCNTMAMTFITV